MNLFCAYETNAEWCCYVFAETRGRAKTIFKNWYLGYECPDYTDIHVSIVKKDVTGDEQVCDDDCQRLKDNGVEYDQTEY